VIKPKGTTPEVNGRTLWAPCLNASVALGYGI